MLRFLDKYQLIKGQVAIGVEIIYNTKDSYTIIAVELTANKGGVEISKQLMDVDFATLKKENLKNVPLNISIGGKGIIHKKVKTGEHTNQQELINQVLPNATLKDFYLQQVNINNNEAWVSIIRKDVLDDLIVEIKKYQLFGVQIYLGPFVLNNCLALIKTTSLITTTHELIINNNQIVQLDSLGSVASGEEYNIEGQIVNSHELLAFGSALSHFIPNQQLIPFNCNEVTMLHQEYLNKKKYLVIGLSLVVFFFVVAVTNMFVNIHYQSVNNDFQYEINSNQKFVEELELLKSELTIKEQFIQNSGVTKASKISFYADQIGMSVPPSIQLNQMFINPLTKRINKSEDIEFNYNKIKVVGTVNRSIELNNWIKILKKYAWAEEVNIISFIQDNLQTPGEFELAITIIQ